MAKHDPSTSWLWKGAKEGGAVLGITMGQGPARLDIECSAMSRRLLGEHFDIHGGGQVSAVPSSRERDRAIEGAHQTKFVNYWMHTASFA